MKKRKLREGLEFQLARAEAFQDMLVERIAERNRARSAARLWKRAAKRYRRERDEVRSIAEVLEAKLEVARTVGNAAAMQADKLREERDAARAELALCVNENTRLNRLVLGYEAEADATGATPPWALPELLRRVEQARDAARAELDVYKTNIVRMRPVVEAACLALECGCWLPESVRSTVEAYRAGGENRFDCPDCGNGVKADEDGCCATCGADCQIIEDGKVVVEPEPADDLPDIQRTYRAPEGDTAERIANDAASDHARPATWVVRRRIEALVGETAKRAEAWESAAGEWRMERDEARNQADIRIRAALEAAAERAVEWFDTLGPISPESLRRAVLGDGDGARARRS